MGSGFLWQFYDSLNKLTELELCIMLINNFFTFHVVFKNVFCEIIEEILEPYFVVSILSDVTNKNNRILKNSYKPPFLLESGTNVQYTAICRQIWYIIIYVNIKCK